MRSIGAAEVDPQRSPMSREILDVKHLQAMLSCEAIDRGELIPVYEPLKMGDLECDHTVRRKQMRHSCGEVVELRDLRQHIVADDEICSPTLGHELLRKLQAEKLDESGNILLARRFGHIGRWLDADHRNAQR